MNEHPLRTRYNTCDLISLLSWVKASRQSVTSPTLSWQGDLPDTTCHAYFVPENFNYHKILLFTWPTAILRHVHKRKEKGWNARGTRIEMDKFPPPSKVKGLFIRVSKIVQH